MSLHLTDVRSSDQRTSTVALTETIAALRLIDRLSLRLGVWLILRSTRRSPHHMDREVHARLVSNERARAVREAAYIRQQLLSPRP